MNTAEWATAVGEFLIAGVILWEMETSRRERFLEEAANERSYENRGKVYSAFCDTEGESVEDKAKRFCTRIWKGNKESSELKRRCEQQIVLLDRLGQIHRRAWFYKGDYVKLFPHAVVLLWMVFEPYIKERRAMTGDWWAKDWERMTKKCLRFLLKDPNVRLTLYDDDREREKDFIISAGELRQLEMRLRSPKRRENS